MKRNSKVTVSTFRLFTYSLLLIIGLSLSGASRVSARLNQRLFLHQASATGLVQGESLYEAPAHDVPPEYRPFIETAELATSDGVSRYVDVTQTPDTPIAISGDTVLVGVPSASVSGNTSQGAAYVFVRNGTTWTEQAKLIADDGDAYHDFGSGVSLDGDTAVIGARSVDEGVNNDQGAVYVFQREGTTWSQQAKLVASDRADYVAPNFGASVALDGNTLLIGAPNVALGFSGHGVVYVFTNDGAGWTEQTKLIASDVDTVTMFGLTLAFEGNTAVIGAEYSESQKGAAYVFVRNGTTWTEEADLPPSEGHYTYFGRSVAISGDRVVIGAPGENQEKGAVYIFVREENSWVQEARLTASDVNNYDEFGHSVAIFGNNVLAGATFGDVSGNAGQGAVYVFVREDATGWREYSKLWTSDGAAWDFFGSAIAGNGDTAVIHAYYADAGNNENQGATYVFERAILDHELFLPSLLHE